MTAQEYEAAYAAARAKVAQERIAAAQAEIEAAQSELDRYAPTTAPFKGNKSKPRTAKADES